MDQLNRREMFKAAGVAAAVTALGGLTSTTRATPGRSGGTFRVLSIDGGGIRGIVPAKILAYFESVAQQPISQLFDLMVGTSTGGILVLGLAAPGPNGQPKMSAQDLLNLYTQRAGDIFTPFSAPSIFSRREPPGTPPAVTQYLSRPQCSPTGLMNVLNEYFGGIPLSATLTNTMAVSYDLSTGQPFVFASWLAGTPQQPDYWLTDAARGTSAAPTLFPVAQIQPIGGGPTYNLADGMFTAGNPVLPAYVAAQQLAGGAANMLLVSLGCGAPTVKTVPNPAHPAGFPNWGLIPWVENGLFSDLVSGPNHAADEAMQYLLPGQYFRYNPPLQGTLPQTGQTYAAENSMVNWTSGNLAALQQAGEWVVQTCQPEINQLIARLTV